MSNNKLITCYIENELNYIEFEEGLRKRSKYGNSDVVSPKSYPECFIHRHNFEILTKTLKEIKDICLEINLGVAGEDDLQDTNFVKIRKILNVIHEVEND